MADCCEEIKAELAALKAEIARLNNRNTVDETARRMAREALKLGVEAYARAGEAMNIAEDVRRELKELKALLVALAAGLAALAALGALLESIPLIPAIC